jgi:acyl carrier protein
MTREHIFEIIKTNLHKVVESTRDVAISEERSMKEYGADSLEIVEVVSRSMKELKLKIPRTELSGAKNLRDLLDIFERRAASQTLNAA